MLHSNCNCKLQRFWQRGKKAIVRIACSSHKSRKAFYFSVEIRFELLLFSWFFRLGHISHAGGRAHHGLISASMAVRRYKCVSQCVGSTLTMCWCVIVLTDSHIKSHFENSIWEWNAWLLRRPHIHRSATDNDISYKCTAYSTLTR